MPLRNASLFCVAALVAAAVVAVDAPAQAQPASSKCAGMISNPLCIPRTVTLDGVRLFVTKQRIRAGDPTLDQSLQALLAKADKALTTGPWSVTDKPQTPPSGDKHDYLSQAPYWWPTQPATADNPWGCPYVQRDGVRNPAIDDIPDHTARGDAISAIYALSLAWYYTGNPAYAQRAELDIRTWFIDPATRMNPSLTYTQFIPCLLDGRGIGIIDFSEALPDVVDAAAILDAGAPGWSAADHAGISGWFGDFLEWLQTSQNGKDEAATLNNHGSFFDEQAAALALYTGQRSLARHIVQTAEHTRIDPQIMADGSQPEELSRTRSWHYSIFNLTALTRLASIGRHVGVDLWKYQNPAGGGLRKAVEFMLPAAVQGATAWNYPELQFSANEARPIIHAAADAGNHAAAQALREMPAPTSVDLWPVQPAADD